MADVRIKLLQHYQTEAIAEAVMSKAAQEDEKNRSAVVAAEVSSDGQ